MDVPQLLLAAVSGIYTPLFWALLIGWIITVVIHEFAHGLVAYLGGDYTIKERGGLTLNPLQYIDPVMSIIMPVIFLIMGGIPLPGGVTYIRTDLLRSKGWETAVALAGPAANLLIFFILLLILHPALGLFDITAPVSEWSNAQVFFGALVFLQAIAVVLNLIPCPPLDGFNAIAPYLPPELVMKVRMPPWNFVILLVFFFLIAQHPMVLETVARLIRQSCSLLKLDDITTYQLWQAFRTAIRGENL